MEKRKISIEELDNVSGGRGAPETVFCRNCKQQIPAKEAFVKEVEGRCFSKIYYKCSKCGHEWNT